MSYDVSVVKGDDTFHIGNYTYNCAPMFNKAFGVDTGWTQLLQDKEVSSIQDKLKEAVDEMKNKPDEYIPLNPPNGWGDYKGALEFLEHILVTTEVYHDWHILIH